MNWTKSNIFMRQKFNSQKKKGRDRSQISEIYNKYWKRYKKKWKCKYKSFFFSLLGAHCMASMAQTKLGTCSPKGKDAREFRHKHCWCTETHTRGLRHANWQHGSPISQNCPSCKSSFAVIPIFFTGFCSSGIPRQQFPWQQSSSPAPVAEREREREREREKEREREEREEREREKEDVSTFHFFETFWYARE